MCQIASSHDQNRRSRRYRRDLKESPCHVFTRAIRANGTFLFFSGYPRISGARVVERRALPLP